MHRRQKTGLSPQTNRLTQALFALLLSLFVVAAPAWSSSSEEKSPAEKTEKAEEGAAPGQPRTPSVDMPILVAPVVVNGEMFHYVYLGVKLQLSDDANTTAVLEKIPYLQDAFLREVHGSSIAFENDPAVVDEKGLVQRLLLLCEKIAGAGVVKNIEFRNTARATN